MGEHQRNPMAQAAAAGLIGPRNGAGVPRVNIDLDELERFGCECGSDAFQGAVKILHVPEILRFATGGGDQIRVQVWKCLGCGKVQGPAEMKKLPPLKPKEENPSIEVVR